MFSDLSPLPPLPPLTKPLSLLSFFNLPLLRLGHLRPSKIARIHPFGIQDRPGRIGPLARELDLVYLSPL